MSTEIATQMKTVQDKVRDRIQTEFINLIPQEMWEQMVAVEIAAFTAEPKIDQWGRRDSNQGTTAHDMIREALNSVAKEKIAKELAGDRWSAHFDGMDYVVGEAIKKIVVEQGDLIMKTMMTGMTQAVVDSAVQAFRSQLQSMNPGLRTY